VPRLSHLTVILPIWHLCCRLKPVSSQISTTSERACVGYFSTGVGADFENTFGWHVSVSCTFAETATDNAETGPKETMTIWRAFVFYALMITLRIEVDAQWQGRASKKVRTSVSTNTTSLAKVTVDYKAEIARTKAASSSKGTPIPSSFPAQSPLHHVPTTAIDPSKYVAANEKPTQSLPPAPSGPTPSPGRAWSPTTPTTAINPSKYVAGLEPVTKKLPPAPSGPTPSPTQPQQFRVPTTAIDPRKYVAGLEPITKRLPPAPSGPTSAYPAMTPTSSAKKTKTRISALPSQGNNKKVATSQSKAATTLAGASSPTTAQIWQGHSTRRS
jgi:hypothetical protein